jgi:TolB-like protein
MPSIIEGYNYDIFISYRQKDNKGDRWVSEFVDALKTELESTFKEEISVYFDINPHDGLLETHDVDASLKEKLKCLIFVPIISRTYCDPKSFAWEHEFKTFVEQASQDQFGLKIRLPNGNVANRVLPVHIHDLDITDIKLCESVLGGVLRGVEFIYKEQGVNRPLTIDDDEKKNINNTKYRNQINKVALAIKEIITAIKKHNQQGGEEVSKEVIRVKPDPQKTLKPKFIIVSAIVLTLLVLGYFLIPKLSKNSEPVEKSIAVLPFKLLSDEPDKQYLADGMMEAILHNLSKIKDLHVMPSTSVEQFRVTTKTTRQIGKELGVEYLLEGRFQKDGNNVKVMVDLIKASKESQAWAKDYDRNWNDVFSVQSEVAQAIASELKAKFTPEEKQLIEKIPTTDLAAYDSYLKGVSYLRKNNINDLKTALSYFELARDKDPKFALAYVGISSTWRWLQMSGDVQYVDGAPKAMAAIMRAIELDSASAEVQCQLAVLKYVMWDWKGAESGFKKAIAINPNYAEAHRGYAYLMIIVGRPKEGMKQIDMALKLDPLNPLINTGYGYDLIYVHKYDKALSVFQDVLKMNPINNTAISNLPVVYHLLGKYKEGFESWKLYYNTEYKNFAQVFDKGYAIGGYAGALNLEADTLVAQSKTAYFPPTEIAILYTCAGNKVRALDMLERAYDVHDPGMVALQNPIFDCLQSEPRYQDLCRKMNLPIKRI